MAPQEHLVASEAAARQGSFMLPLPVEYEEKLPDLVDQVDYLENRLHVVADRRGFFKEALFIAGLQVTAKIPRTVRETSARLANYPGFPFAPADVESFLKEQPPAGGSGFIPLTFHQIGAGESLVSIATMYGTEQGPWDQALGRATWRSRDKSLRVGMTLLAGVVPGKSPLGELEIPGYGWPVKVGCAHLGIGVYQDPKGRISQQWQWCNAHGGKFMTEDGGWQLVGSPGVYFAHENDYMGQWVHGLSKGDRFANVSSGVRSSWRISDRQTITASQDTELVIGSLVPGSDQLRLVSCLGEDQRVVVTATRV